MRVVQRHADGLAAVLEREDLLDAGQRAQRGGAVGPRFDHGAGPGLAETRERAERLGAEADDLAATDRGASAAEAERGQVVEVVRRILGIGRKERAEGGERFSKTATS
ncbi:hypothetical protein GCM10025867_14590 [Frondihabitans sucicola]|uniref:Uncharacterized protein n=1 Tax=Frondihabitans sucicola TaxID=1268041 RepID=A0ABN6XYL5_9MICO|nr:hypothetical protein GCM10025867_14590 [Frondihabitans sucicola]